MLSALTQPAQGATHTIPSHAAILLADRPPELFAKKVSAHVDQEKPHRNRKERVLRDCLDRTWGANADAWKRTHALARSDDTGVPRSERRIAAERHGAVFGRPVHQAGAKYPRFVILQDVRVPEDGGWLLEPDALTKRYRSYGRYRSGI
jgi:hypothetical protein